MCSALLLSDHDSPDFTICKQNSHTFDIFVLQMEERILKASKKPLLMDSSHPAQAEKSEVTVERTSESLHENTEQFFVTQVCTCSSSLLGKINCFSKTHVAFVPMRFISLNVSNNFSLY